eukprot:gene21995-22535_t
MRAPLAVPLFAAAAAAATGGRDVTLTSGGAQRRALLHIPPLPAAPARVPLIANLHTLCEWDRMEEDLSGMSALADREGFAVGIVTVGRSWNGGACCPKASAERVPDTQFVRDVIADVK